ncbi:hypothetical protein NK718_10310 [Alsobacter sp. SYSU M60028]|uniref:DUF3040 domain-containing protein n=1 Tax=Alsobacter ponti TaxID=2962936 RepID=A0ABT1LCV5_9HYPH|nr:hypothetical protein [Alsobacter ponti]MCP8938908.1 hypothetical protein [Alsobacter ponti]
MPHLRADALVDDAAGMARLAAVLDSDPRCRALRAEVRARLSEDGGMARRVGAHFGLEIGLPLGIGLLATLCAAALWLAGAPTFI